MFTNKNVEIKLLTEKSDLDGLIKFVYRTNDPELRQEAISYLKCQESGKIYSQLKTMTNNPLKEFRRESVSYMGYRGLMKTKNN